MDIDTLVAGLLHDTIEDTSVKKIDLEKKFNKDIAHLVSGVSKLSGIKFKDYKHKQAENLMKMFLAVAKDLRVIIIKFSDRLHNMKTLDSLPKEKQIRISQETKDLYAPLAHRLGMNELKMDYENLVLKYVDNNSYKNIKKKINTTNKVRTKFIEEFIKPIQSNLLTFSINAKVFGRAKHYYSIYRKMNLQSKNLMSFMTFAIRIIVDKIEECYSVLGIVHQIYTQCKRGSRII